MTRKRSRFINAERPSKFLSAKFRKENEEKRTTRRPMSSSSSVRSSYSSIPTRSYDDDILYVPFRPQYSSFGRYDSTGEENYSRSQVNRELLMSSAALEDNYDLSMRSRNRDKDVLAAANRAITPQPTVGRESRGVSPLPRRGALRRSQSALSLRSHSVPAVQPTFASTAYSTALVPVDTSALRASAAPKPSQYLMYSKAIDTAKSLREGTYSPMYSRSIRTSVSPLRDRSLSLFRSESPIRSPSPLSRTSPQRNSRSLQKHRAPRVLANKRRVGNYYTRLLSRRSSGGRDCKYWPYLDVDEIEYTDLGDLCSDTEDYEDSGEKYAVQTNRSRDYDDEQDNSAPVRYVYEYDTDIPDDYVPFRPKVRYRSPDKDYSQMSLIPFIPQRDPTKNSIADTVTFNALVAESAARARKILEQRVNFDEYDSAGLVLSVEGEFHSPDIDTPLGFRYVSRPMSLKVPAAESVSTYKSDDSFSQYWTDLQKFREGIRSRLEEGYNALSSTTRSYTPALTSSYTPPSPSSTSTALTSYSSRPSRKSSYYKRLRDDKEYKYGQSLELYPLESPKGTLAPRRALSTSDDIRESRAMSAYEINSDSDSRMSVLAKVKIKVDTELNSSPRYAVAVRRAMRGQSTPPPSAVYRKTEAALIGSKVDTVSPNKGFRRRPKSAFAQEKMRHMDKQYRDSSPVAVCAVSQSTSDLKASRPVYVPPLKKRIHDVDGVKPSNILSWQYKLDAIASPDDVIIVPRSLCSVKAQLRETQDKMTRHRQLLDRYLDTDTGLTAEDKRVLMKIKHGVPKTQAASTQEEPYTGPMSAARRNARRVLCVTKGNLNYYKSKE